MHNVNVRVVRPVQAARIVVQVVDWSREPHKDNFVVIKVPLPAIVAKKRTSDRLIDLCVPTYSSGY